MRHGLALVLALCCGLAQGCFSAQPTRTLSQYGSRAPFQGPTGDDVVHLFVALVERPLGDDALNQEIWQLADEQGVDLEQKVLLHQNGFRMGQFGSSPPSSLLELIRSARSCANPRWRSIRAGNQVTVLLDPRQAHCCFQLVQSGEAKPVELDQAQLQLQVTPTLTRDGKTRLQLTPCIKHGQPSVTTRAVMDPGGILRWDMECQQPVESYPQLSWQQTVSDSDFVVVGTWLNRQGTLGQRCFLETDVPPPLQRLLVLRAWRNGPDNWFNEDCLSKSTAIAAQAGLTTVRGSNP